MKIQLTKKNISEDELARALAGIATEEGVSRQVHELLGNLRKSKRDGEEDEIPERYMRYIADKFKSDFNALIRAVSDDVDKWIDNASKLRKSFLRKADDPTPLLSQEQMDELRALIESRFRIAIGIGFSVPDDVKKRWSRMGIVDPTIHLDEWIVQSYVAGRIADMLDNKTSYADMLKLAKKLPMSRQDKLIIEMSKANSAKYIVGYGEKLGQLATNVALDQHKKSINEIIQQYFTGDLNHSINPESGFAPEEESVIRRVTSWRGLASELRDRFKQTDVARDWERVAFTEMRYATNLGRMMNIQHEGGGDPQDIEVFYHVLPTACTSCKKLYLNSDGTPKIFKLSEILKNVQETGGMNIGRKASTIGKADGWLPNAVVHPNCHCYPVRKIGGYAYAEFQRKETGAGSDEE
jgi:hypothetical protein